MKGLCLLILPFASPRDVVMPGFHKVQHEVVFVQNDLLAEHRLVATPLRGFAGFQEVVAGEPIPYSHKYGTKVYAVPADLDLSSAAPTQAREVFKDAAWPWTYVETGGQSVAPNASRIHRWRTTVRLASVSPEKIELEVLERQGQTQDGRPVSRWETTVIASLLVAAGAAGLVWLRRRRVRRAAPADA